MSCEYCRGTRTLIEQRDRLSRKGDFYPGLELYISEHGVLDIVAVPDTYEPCYMNESIQINFCPMCGRDLSEDDDKPLEKKDLYLD